MPLLSLNVDHIATVRNARGGPWPCPVAGALLAESFGVDGITAHLREDRRHITDADVTRLRAEIATRLNLEMALTDEMVAIALKLRPDQITLVPERREELTTEGGLDVATLGQDPAFKRRLKMLLDADLPVSLFIDPDLTQVEASQMAGVQLVEFHTGQYCEAFAQTNSLNAKAALDLEKLKSAAQSADALGLVVNAGHGLNFKNTPPILAMKNLHELNIGHFLISQAIFDGLGPVLQTMKQAMQAT
ncbi:MAG: pyridoxine 5'-phosphate synthase [Vampirovibrionales bacterium]|nr:pyridoxine 5'-phosphate synthase [Vampirovibrionales bacterium]